MAIEFEVIKTITLDEGVFGQYIIDAVRKIAGTNCKEIVRIVDNKRTLLIGRYSPDGYENLYISTSADFSQTFIDPIKTYNFLAVVFHKWPGSEYGLGSMNIDRTEKSMENFRDRLLEYLSF